MFYSLVRGIAKMYKNVPGKQRGVAKWLTTGFLADDPLSGKDPTSS